MCVKAFICQAYSSSSQKNHTDTFFKRGGGHLFTFAVQGFPESPTKAITEVISHTFIPQIHLSRGWTITQNVSSEDTYVHRAQIGVGIQEHNSSLQRDHSVSLLHISHPFPRLHLAGVLEAHRTGSYSPLLNPSSGDLPRHWSIVHLSY